LPTAWGGFSLPVATLSTAGKLPHVPLNVVLHKGLFKDTLPGWRTQVTGPVAFVHIDCDVYLSTVDVLTGIAERLQPGTVIVFDEYFNYPNWQYHEFKAWKEFVEGQDVRYEYLGYARQQVAVKITGIGKSGETDSDDR